MNCKIIFLFAKEVSIYPFQPTLFREKGDQFFKNRVFHNKLPKIIAYCNTFPKMHVHFHIQMCAQMPSHFSMKKTYWIPSEGI